MAQAAKPIRQIPGLMGNVAKPSKPGISSRYNGGISPSDRSYDRQRNGEAGGGSFLFGWNPYLREPMEDTIEAYVEAAARTIDAMHNSGWLAGALDQAIAQMIGTGLTVNPKPDVQLFGGDEAAASSWSRDAEKRFTAWANDRWSVDLGGRYTLGQLARQGALQFYASGEQVAALPYVKRPGDTHGLKVNMLPSSRLAQYTTGLFDIGTPAYPGGAPTRMPVVQGVILGAHNEPVGYIFWNRVAGGLWNTVQQEIVAAKDASGREVILHMLDNGPGAVRGITPLAPALKVIRQLDQLADGTLTAALIQTIFAATVTSSDPTKDVMQALQDVEEGDDVASVELGTDIVPPGSFDALMGARREWYEHTQFDLGRFGKVAHMFPGEKLEMNRSEHPNSNYLPMNTSLLREIMRCIGITYEQGTGDYTNATYTSLKAGNASSWLVNLNRRAMIPAPLYRAVWTRWLEEEIIAGTTTFPGGIENFRANKIAASSADFRGPARPTEDDLKTAKAQQILRAEGWMTYEQLCDFYGNDWRDTMDGIARETAYRREKKDAEGNPLIAEPPSLGGSGGPASGGDSEDAEDGGDGEGSGSGGAKPKPRPGRGSPSNKNPLELPDLSDIPEA